MKKHVFNHRQDETKWRSHGSLVTWQAQVSMAGNLKVLYQMLLDYFSLLTFRLWLFKLATSGFFLSVWFSQNAFKNKNQIQLVLELGSLVKQHLHLIRYW